jgi:hypothetical protein
MSKVTFEMDGDEYCSLMEYKCLGTIGEWKELKLIKDNCPVLVEVRQQLDSYGEYNKTIKYWSKNVLFDEITKLNQELNDKAQKLNYENKILKKNIKNISFVNRIHFLFTGRLFD